MKKTVLALDHSASVRQVVKMIFTAASSEAGPAVGLVTDCVFEVTNLSGLELQPPPAIGRKWRLESVTGVGRRGEDFVIAPNMERLLATEGFLLAQSAEAA